MKVEEIENMWAEDAKIDDLELGKESAKIPILHHKYYKIFIRSLIEYEKQLGEFSTLERNKHMYYSGYLTTAEIRDLGWEPWNLKIPKTDVQKYIDSDDEVIRLKIKCAVLNEKVNYLKSILKQIGERNFIIKNMIDFKKFENGII